ncbi:XRE family transcriptional regulator [Megasphaera stantonii]|uniref:XRE family transcriptional regulator n=1 Tax=Megasphaera stantonii TaxID=2144175 RepID=A0A346B135_9FIRM|nr:XRE family transcriptional regulator [Megasphaera stantonii]
MNRIRELRNNKGITQTELGKILSVQKAAVSKYELGLTTPSPEILKKMSEYFNVSIDYLLGNDRQTASPPAEKMPKDMKKYLEQSEVIFDGDVYHLDDEGRDMVRQALKMAFLAAKEANKRKKK